MDVPSRLLQARRPSAPGRSSRLPSPLRPKGRLATGARGYKPGRWAAQPPLARAWELLGPTDAGACTRELQRNNEENMFVTV